MLVETEQNTMLNTTTSGRGVDALLTRVRLRAKRRVLWMQSQANRAQDDNFAGLAISPAEVERLLEDAVETAAKEEIFYQTDAAVRELNQPMDAADLAFANDPAWKHLRQQFMLSEFEMDLLALCVAAGADSSLLRVYAYLHDDAGACHPTPWLTGRLFQRFPLPSLSPEGGLVKWQLARPLDHNPNPWAVNAPWVIDPQIMLWLLGCASIDPVLEDAVQFLPKEENAARICLYPEQLAQMLDMLRIASEREPGGDGAGLAVELELVAPDGGGKRTLAAQFAASLGADLMAIDAESLLTPDLPAAGVRDRALHVIRMARLTGSLVYWRGGDRIDPRLRQAMKGGTGVMLFGSRLAGTANNKSGAIRRSFVLPALRTDMKASLWHEVSEQPVPAMIAEWTLPPGEIVRAAQVAHAGEGAILESLQQGFQLAQSDLFTPLACPFDWDDIVLAPHVREHLAELEQQVRLRWSVYEEWGFERLCPLGRGITALFSGPSGTGKTMAAQVLARSLNMNLFRVDLSGVMNKYIGETEKRLRQVFDACERANVLLFFDEADALFGKRTQVKDAHDRFANIEIDYLLQRMEQFEGVAVLATNRKSDLDRAFVRRIRFMVEFAPPGPPERVALWRRALAEQSPGGAELLDGIDFHSLAQKLNMTGAEITSAALSAAFLARSEGSRISMRHVMHAARREMSKHDIVMRVGDWES
jgi:hypothetical protein